jgi:hypothetical protein
MFARVSATSPPPACPGLGSRRWNLFALLVFGAALAFLFAEVWRTGPRSVVPMGRPVPGLEAYVRADVTFEAWLVARNARTLLHEPWRIFDTEHCAPGERTLTLGVPMLTMGLVAVPATLLGDPILSYNAALVALVFVSALSMYLLATDWTGVPAAGIAAGLLFGFHDLRIGNLYHPAELDIAWTVFALFFARRLFSDGRWRDAVGLAVACALQIAASFYPTLAAVFLAPPLAAWLLLAYGLRRVRPSQLAFVVGAVALAAAIVLGPYLEQRGASPGHLQREIQYYAVWSEYLPGRPFFPGWVLLGLMALGLSWPRRLGFPGLPRDPRWALACAGILVAIIAGGSLGDTILAPFGVGPDAPVPYEILARVLPGLDTVRVVLRLSIGVVLVASLLAAAGVAGCWRCAGRFALPGALGLIALSAVEALLILPARGAGETRRVIQSIRPEPESLAFFAALEAQGNRGPILELPYLADVPQSTLGEPERILTAAWHHRRTSSCFGSYPLPESGKVAALAAALPHPDAIRELVALGFTTIVIHDPKGVFGAPLQHRIARGVRRRGVRLRPLLESSVANAFAIELGPRRPASPANEPVDGDRAG